MIWNIFHTGEGRKDDSENYNEGQGSSRDFVKGDFQYVERNLKFFLPSCAWKYGNNSCYVTLIQTYLQCTVCLVLFVCFFAREVSTVKNLNGIATDYLIRELESLS